MAISKKSVLLISVSTSFWFAPVASLAQQEVKAPVNCAEFKPIEVTVDGQKMLRYRVKNGDELRCVPKQPTLPWIVKKTSWSQADELEWQDFVTRIGKAIEQKKCSTVDTCLISSANPYRDESDMKATHFADCADYPVYLRAYFAFKKNLPFSFGNGLKANPPQLKQLEEAEIEIQKAQGAYDQLNYGYASAEQLEAAKKKLDEAIKAKNELINPENVLYSGNGTHFTGRYNVVNTAGVTREFFGVTRAINDQFSSGSLRMLLTPPGKPLADFYAPKIDRESIIPGTVLYDAKGHVAMVYEVTPNGQIKLMDAKLDSSVGVDVYGTKFQTSRVVHAAGLKNWRPIKVINPQMDRNGNIVKGTTIQVPDLEIPDFSMEQYFGNQNKDNSDALSRKWIINGKSVSWYDYVEEKLADSTARYSPVQMFSEQMDRLCDQLQQRGNSINNIVKAGIHLKPHPKNLPQNVYNGDPEWHQYAIYRRDVNIRIQAFEAIDLAKKMMNRWSSRDPRMDYDGNNLKRDLIKAYNASTAKCEIRYTNSSNQIVKMPFAVALTRLTAISPTPYFCPERMWGAKFKAELKDCPDDLDKMEWYRLTQFFRNSRVPDTTKTMGWSIQDIRNVIDKDMADQRDRSDEYNILKALNQL